MQFDWVTWSIWLIGLVITVVWTIVPLKEFLEIVRAQHGRYKERIAAEQEEHGK